MPHRSERQAFGKNGLSQVSVAICGNSARRSAGVSGMINYNELAKWAAAALVILCGGLAGHYAASGMTPVQWAGALCSVLGSVTVAVAIHVWPAPQKAQRQRQRQRD
jgi:hypothetical protein